MQEVQRYKDIKIQKINHQIPEPSHHLVTLCFLHFAFCFLLSCNNIAPTGVIGTSSTKTEETDPFILGNRKMIELENEDIELFLKRYEWKMKQTNTGLRYEITKKGSGKKIEKGETVSLEYRTWLLNGIEIYNSDNDGLKQFAIEKSTEIAGLHEAVLLMNKDAEARLIIPSYLAYGVSGDGNKVLPYQTIVMYVKVVNKD
ncbi:MAG: FKBP-type peptidyl-prolyl cis-trans isomerase [Lentimicrobiaceae bacterium]|nr:FKBP-type peptidyl-prolyl cis-trans isomerase [Lentimicrobiaceae bacterium]